MPNPATNQSLDREAMRLAKPSVGGVAWPSIGFGLAVALAYTACIAAAAAGAAVLLEQPEDLGRAAPSNPASAWQLQEMADCGPGC